MRKTVIVIAVLLVAWAALAAWPFVGLYRIVQAAHDNDIAGLSERVNFPAVRRGLIEQILVAYNRLTGGNVNVNPGGAVFILVATIADPIVAKMVSPEALAELLRTGWPQSVLPQQAGGVAGIAAPNIRDAWPLFLSSHYGIGRFSIALPPEKPQAEAYVLELHLDNWRWRLARVVLPEGIATRLAQELAKARPR